LIGAFSRMRQQSTSVPAPWCRICETREIRISKVFPQPSSIGTRLYDLARKDWAALHGRISWYVGDAGSGFVHQTVQTGRRHSVFSESGIRRTDGRSDQQATGL